MCLVRVRRRDSLLRRAASASGCFGECVVDSSGGARGSKRALPDSFLFCFLLGGVWADDALLYLPAAHGTLPGTAMLE